MVHISGEDVKEVKTHVSYQDVAMQSGLVYATSDASQSRPHAVHVYDRSTWCRLWEIPSPCCSAEHDNWHTLHVSDDRILLCCDNKDKLYVLSHSGELLQTHGRSRREATGDDIIGQTASGEPVYGSGVLFYPRLCQVDAEGSALVCDRRHHRFQVMRADGTWSVVKLDQPVRGRRGAAWCNASLYVANNNAIVRFSAL